MATETCKSLTTYRLSEVMPPAFFGLHRQIKEGTVSEALCTGGRAGAKSSWISEEIETLMVKNPDTHAVVFRKKENTLRRSVFNQYIWALGALGISGQWKVTVSPMELVYKPTGQKIMFFGLDDPGNIKSLKLPFGYVAFVHFEELDQFSGPEEIRNVEQSLLRGGPMAITFKSFNPPASAGNWANRYVLEQKPGQVHHHSTYLDTPPEWLGPRFLAEAEHLKEVNPTAYRNEYLGEVTGNGANVFDNVKLTPISDEEITRFDRVYMGLDWGFYPDPWAFNKAYYDAARMTLYIFDEAEAYRKGNEATVRMLKQEHGVTGRDLITADSAEPKSVADYKSFGLWCRGARKGPGSVDYSMKWLGRLAAIIIDPKRCPKTAKEFSEYEFERNRDGELISTYPDRNNHHIDAVRYAMETVWKHRGK